MSHPRRFALHLLVVLAAGVGVSSTAAAQRSAAAVVDTALARMGGAQAARDVKRARFEVMTQWQRTVFDERPYADQPGYESNTDLRDYEARAWRNTRRFSNGRTTTELVDVVADSVAARRSPGGPGGVAAPAIVAPGTWVPLNIAYVDERRELFAMAPERLLLAARAAPDLRALPDTVIAGAPHARVAATVNHAVTTLFVRRSTGFLTAARFRAAAPNDYGLVPWGTMDVETWFSVWRKQPGGLVYPFEWDVRRVGRAYKRMTVVAATFNPPVTPDSFVVSDSVRAAYVATATRPMHDVPLDSAHLVEGRFASFATPGAPAGAVKLGSAWVLLEAGQAPLGAERAAAWLAASDAGSRIAAALVTMPAASSGGVAWLVPRRVPIDAAPGAVPFVETMLRGHDVPATGVTAVARGRWLHVGGDSLWLEPIDLPDAPGSLIAYSPSLQWVYGGSTANPLHLDLVLARARARGWQVTRTGSARDPMVMLPPPLRVAGAAGG